MTNKIFFAGDWHGSGFWAESVINAAGAAGVTDIYHVGDFGYMGKNLEWYIDKLQKLCANQGVKIWVTPGNHENWDLLDAMFVAHPEQPVDVSENGTIFMLPRNYRWEQAGVSFLSLGGAPSIDRSQRQPWESWWPTEALTYGDVARAIAGGPADIMITHDAPTYFPSQVYDIIYKDFQASVDYWGEDAMQYCKEGHDLLNTAYEAIKPKLLVHGHYHVWEHWRGGENQHVLALAQEKKVGNVVRLDLDEFYTGVVEPQQMGKFLY